MVSEEQQALHDATQRLLGKGLPAPLAQRVAGLDAQSAGLDIVEVAEQLALPLDAVGRAYFGVGGRLELGWLSQQIVALPSDTRWLALARLAMRSDLSALARELTRSALQCQAAPPAASSAEAGQDEGAATQALIDCWLQQHAFAHGRVRQLLADLKPTPALDMAMLSVVLRELRAMV
jgi:glutamate dehydrogenase